MPFFLPLLVILTNFTPPSVPKTTLSVEVQNVRSSEGRVHIGLFRPCAGFPGKCKPAESKLVTAAKGTVRTSFEVEPGDYALAVYHDLNGNGKIDTRLFGIPKEPYGFSNNSRPRFSAPKFADCQVRIGDEAKTIRIRVE